MKKKMHLVDISSLSIPFQAKSEVLHKLSVNFFHPDPALERDIGYGGIFLII